MLNLTDMRNTLLLLLLFSSVSVLAGGGWTYRKGKGYFKLGENVIRADQSFGPNGKLTEKFATISMYTTSVYGEYGITDKLTGILYMPFFVRSTINAIRYNQTGIEVEGDEENAFGDTNLGLKYGFFQDKAIVLGVSLTLGLPLGETAGGKGKILQTGDGELNQLLRVDASHSFHPIPLYATVFAGYNNRTEGFSDEIHLGGEVGYTLSNFNFALKVHSLNSTYIGSENVFQIENSLFGNNVEYFSYTPEIAYTHKDKLGVAISAGYAASGKRILADPNYSIGIFLKI